jgi:N-acyl-D-amino-acid deacylase
MGDADRKATPAEEAKMRALVDQEMKSGALGLSTGLEYVPNRYADTDEVVDLASVAAAHHGIYISHVRNEDKYAFAAFKELIEVARRAKLPAEINHIKLGSSVVWHRAPEVIEMMKAARAEGLDITADVYPYLYWQSTIRVLITTENFDDRKQWEQGLADIGGADRVLLTSYSPNPAWAGRTLAQIATSTGKDPVTVAQQVVAECYGKGKHGEESVVVTAMCEDDLRTFIGSPLISFCSDGGLHVTHPRGAGSFPRDLGVYVRQNGLISLSEAIRKMTSLPASRFGFQDRGHIEPGMKADLTLFDPATVLDTSTTSAPWSAPVGIPTVLVNGVPVLLNGKLTGAHPGRPLPRQGTDVTWTAKSHIGGPWHDSSPEFDAGGG